ncbi:MAG: NLP/P60-like protein, partial [Pelosinus sp.]|nr:NLP/P60-like protein [Pelosinus sp.]
DGQVRFIEAAVPIDGSVNLGDLPYTRANIIKQAFKFYGQPYGWGGLGDSVDCSSFTMDIYRCFGFMMPRDADTQEVGVGKVWAVTQGNVETVLNKALPGATLHMNGHVMLYLGHIDDSYYVINSLGSYGDRRNVGNDGMLARVPVMQVVTTDIKKTSRRNGKSFMAELHTVKQWEY